MKIGYEQTDKKIEIEIYGIKFEIKNVEKIEEFENVKDDDLDGIKKIIDTLLGDGAVDKLNEQRKKDGYKEIDNAVALNIFLGIFNTYTGSYVDGVIRPLEETQNRFNNFNRQNRRNNRRRYYDRY